MASLCLLGFQGFPQGLLRPIPLSLVPHAALRARGQLCGVAQAKDLVDLAQHLQAVADLLLDLFFPGRQAQRSRSTQERMQETKKLAGVLQDRALPRSILKVQHQQDARGAEAGQVLEHWGNRTCSRALK